MSKKAVVPLLLRSLADIITAHPRAADVEINTDFHDKLRAQREYDAQFPSKRSIARARGKKKRRNREKTNL
jgi:hypothetical protein